MKAILSIDPVRYPLTGIGRYTLELARHLEGNNELEVLRFFSGISFKDQVPGPEYVATPGLASRVRPVKAAIARNDLALRAHQWLSHERRARALRGFEDHVFHGTNFYLPRFSGPSVTTIHDLSVFKYPQYHPAERVRHMDREVRVALERATIIITVSEAVKVEISAHFGWPDSRIHVSPLAAGSHFRPMTSEQTRDTLSRYGVRERSYSLFLGTIEPRKNLENLLEAYERIPAKLRMTTPLLLIGHRGWRDEAIIARIARAREEGWAKYVGYAAEADLPALYGAATVVLFPSIYEGFGLPVLEALACGAPVVTSNTSSLPEVAGGAAMLVDPFDVSALADAFQRALEDNAWQASMRVLGPQQAANFTWHRCAVATLDAYRAAQRLA